MPFEKPTVDQIRNRMLRDYTLLISDAEVGEDSDYWVNATLIANVAAAIYANGAWAYDQADPKTAAEDGGLAIYGSTYNIQKLGEAFASGTATVSASFITTIPDGTFVKNESTGARYKTVGLASVNPAATPPGTIALVALASGPTSDAVAGTVLTFESPPPGVNPVATVIDISGGDVPWDTARLRREIAKGIRAKAAAGNPEHLISLGNAVPGVEQTFVYPALRGSGTNDIVIVTSAATGSRIAGASLLNRVGAALLFGTRAPGGDFIGGIPHDVYENTNVNAAIAQPTDVVIGLQASIVNAFGTWPPAGVGYAVQGDETTWYQVAGSTALTSLLVAAPTTGVVVAPTNGKVIGVFFPSKGFCRATITNVVGGGGGPWTITVGGWTSSDGSAPAETLVPFAVVSPWSDSLTQIAGAPVAGSLALTGAVPAFFAKLGPGEMTQLTVDDVGKRRRYPGVSDTDPIDGTVEFPATITSRLGSAVDDGTDCVSSSTTIRAGSLLYPAIPSPSYIGTPPSILTIGSITVIPTFGS